MRPGHPLIKAVLGRVYYGKSPSKDVPKAEQSPHINDCLAELKKEVGDITDVYDYLSEYVHPNHGSNTLVARGEIGYGELEPDPALLANVLVRMCGYCVCAIKMMQELELEGARTCILVSDLSTRAVKRGATVSNVFAKRPAKPQGDGKSKETAFHFPRARTPQEAIGMIHEYLVLPPWASAQSILALGGASDGAEGNCYG